MSSASGDTGTVRENPQEKIAFMNVDLVVSRGGGGREALQNNCIKDKIDGLLDGILRVYAETVGLSQHILLHENPIPKTISVTRETSSNTDACLRDLPSDQHEQ